MGDENSVWMLGGTGNSGGPRGALQIPPLRYAPVGMTKGRVLFSGKVGEWLKEPALRFGLDDNSVCSQKVQGATCRCKWPLKVGRRLAAAAG
jgi:hypothetical protein